MKKTTYKYIELSIYYVLIFFILREWLVPIMQLTGTGHMDLILIFIALSLVVSLFKIHFIISWIVKGLYISWFIVRVYSDTAPFSAEGFRFLKNDLWTNFSSVILADWTSITDSFRTFLFFVLIWMLIYLVHHWITVRMNIFYFLVITVFFIAILDTFTRYDGSFAIVKVVLLGLIMTSFLYVKRLFKQAGIQMDWKKYILLLMPIILLIGLTSSVAIFLPKASPQWPDPVPFIKSATGQGEVGEGTAVSKVGYGDDDETLGGSFVADDQVVFLAEAETKQYWRVETKDVYTSKGWEKSDYFLNEFSVFKQGDRIAHSLPIGPEDQTKTSFIKVVYPYEFIIHPYGLKSVYTEEPNVELFMDSNTEKITPTINTEETVLSNYVVEYSKPTYLYSNLKKPTEVIDSFIRERYLQLPNSLPDRVVELANQIIKGKETPYDQARAIEGYFGMNGFRYDTENVAIPAKDQDYVDQFLFDTKVGYCDNFSTSMVVMLRSIGIPARWVKGFAGGEVIDRNGDVSTFEITNNDAHSWVEAYIPNVGWVNFEPTIGFTNTRSIDYDLEKTETNQDETLTVDEDTEPEETVEKKTEKEEMTSDKGSKLFENVTKSLTQGKYIYLSILIVILILILVLMKYRRKWIPKMLIKFKGNQSLDESSLEKHYLQLLKILELQGIKRKEGQTLTAFAKEVDQKFETNYMTQFTLAYEEFIYGEQLSETDFAKLKECWEYLINRSSG
ncbi:DUF4129 domain-containing transglutaminase family protein [Ureibacillus composti]